ncbi:MAG TPA: ATP-grasp domain-containing protein [Rhizomicrobium sp.]|jgi:biotin carboxylase
MHGSTAERKTLLVISGGVEAAEAARHAKDLGLYVVVSDRDPAAAGFADADSILIADADSGDETSAAAERFSRKIRRVDGAISLAANAPMTLASVTKRLGVAGPSQQSAELACDKLAAKKAMRAAGIPVPWFALAETPQALARIIIESGRDLVIKPVDCREGRGVQRLATVADMDRAFALARSHSPTGRVMVERRLEGPQITAQSLVSGGHCATPMVFDRNFEHLERTAPFFVGNGGEMPSALPPELQSEVRDVVTKTAEALGIAGGPFKTDVVVVDGKPHVIDAAAAFSPLCVRGIPLAMGVDFMGAAIRMAVGDAVSPDELVPQIAAHVVQRCLFSAPGRIVSIAGADEARAMAGVFEIVMCAKAGDMIPRAHDKRPPVATVLATGTSRESALAAANEALARIRIVTEPSA